MGDLHLLASFASDQHLKANSKRGEKKTTKLGISSEKFIINNYDWVIS